MTDYQIPASAIEAAAKRRYEREMEGEPEWKIDWKAEPAAVRRLACDYMADDLRAAFDELGMERIECDGILFSSIEPKLYLRGWRFESRWMPVEKP